MKILLSLLLAALLLGSACAAAEKETPSPAWAAAIGELTGARQVACVAALGDSRALFSMHEKDEGGVWRVVVSAPALIGREGLGKTRVGDMKTPQGVYTLDCAFGISEDPGCALPYHHVTEYDYWSGDERVHYNEMVDIRDWPALNTEACEHLSAMGAAYNYCLNIGYNPEGEPNAGAAIFLHCANPDKSWTAGCVAIPEEDMAAVLRRIDEGCVIVIDSFETLTGAIQ